MNLRQYHFPPVLTLLVFIFELVLSVFTSGASLYMGPFQDTHVNTPYHQSIYSLLAWEESNANEEERDERGTNIESDQYNVQEFFLIHFTHRFDSALLTIIFQSTTTPRLFQVQRKLII